MPRVSEVRISIFNAIVYIQWNLYSEDKLETKARVP